MENTNPRDKRRREEGKKGKQSKHQRNPNKLVMKQGSGEKGNSTAMRMRMRRDSLGDLDKQKPITNDRLF